MFSNSDVKMDRMSLQLLPPSSIPSIGSYRYRPHLDPRHDPNNLNTGTTPYARVLHSNRTQEHRSALMVTMSRAHGVWQNNQKQWLKWVRDSTKLIKPLINLIYAYHSPLIYSISTTKS
jgi:hypothetical protein